MSTTTKTLYGARISFFNPNVGLVEEVAVEFTTEDERDTFYYEANMLDNIQSSGMYTRIVYTDSNAALEAFRIEKGRGLD